WPSMQAIAELLGHVESLAVAIAKNSYLECCRNKPFFYENFYKRFFEKQPKSRELFSNLEKQYAMLDRSLTFLLNFTSAPRIEPTDLTEIAEKHQALAVSSAQYDDF